MGTLSAWADSRMRNRDRAVSRIRRWLCDNLRHLSHCMLERTALTDSESWRELTFANVSPYRVFAEFLRITAASVQGRGRLGRISGRKKKKPASAASIARHFTRSDVG
jgi:hypothetical protein